MSKPPIKKKKSNAELPDYKKKGFDSLQEYQISIWLEEAKLHGLVNTISYQPEAFVLNEELVLMTTNAKGKNVKLPLLKKHVYTSDFKITCSKSILNDMVSTILKPFRSTNNEVYIEVKPDLPTLKLIDSTNMTRLFMSRTQPWVFEKYGIFVNLITPNILFSNTFVPTALLDDYYYKKSVVTKKVMKRKGDCKVDWKIRNINEYLKTL